jgi:tRNA 2-thiouridine synthesizing protein E
MPTYEVNGRIYEVDEDGFLEDPTIWSDDVAKDFALTEAVADLTEDHWKVVRYLRNYYLEFGIAPMIRKLCKETGFKLNQIYELFPSGPAKGACKIAGLPKPTGCV